MEEFEGVMFDEGDFEVVDECTGEEDPVATETEKQAEASNTEDPVAVSSKSNNSQDDCMEVRAEDDVDFSVDISIDTEVLRDETIEEEKSDAPDVIIIEPKKEGENAENATETNSVVELISPDPEWYQEKLQAKKEIVNERLSKLARVLELSYPAYKPWLEHSETPVCHLDPPRRCPLDRPYTNRWKFICSRKPVQDSTSKEEDSAEGTVDKKLETVWRLGPTEGSAVNTDNASQYPPFVMRVVKVFEEFIQNIEESLDNEPPVDEASADPDKSSDDVAQEKTNVEKPAEEKTTVKDESVDGGQDAPSDVAKSGDDNEETTPTTTTSNDDNAGQPGERTHNWLWLLVRSNSKDELMVFATGKKISDSTMQKLKQTFETGPGKDCNVKSLYCKSIYGKNGGTASSNITFLVGTEALDETVGGVKIQLAPKTNFWSNASGVEQLGAAVGDMLKPLQKTNVVEVGCGLGLIGLMLAPDAKRMIGIDAPSEVEEAEMTCEMNKIENASFIAGTKNSELMEKVSKILSNTRAAAIVNGNTKLGRDIEVMTALRKIQSLRRVVLITTLTKQSVRAILELTRPLDADLGNPFMPLRAVLVDTLPTGPHFEVVIRMERLNMNKMNEPWFWNHVKFRAGLSNELPRKNPPDGKGKSPSSSSSVQAKKTGVKDSPGAKSRSHRRNRMRKQRAAIRGIVLGAVTGVVRTPTANIVKNPLATSNRNSRTRRGGKRSHSPDKPGSAKKPATTNDSPASPDPSKPVKVAKSTKAPESSTLRRNPLARPQNGRQRLSGAQKRNRRHWAQMEAARSGNHQSGPPEKRMRGNGNHGDLRGRLSDAPRIDPHLMQQVREQQMLLNITQQRLGGQQGPMLDVDTAKQLQNMLNIVIEETNKLQNKLPRSVWDRIAPPPDNYSGQNMQQDPMMFRDRFVQDIGPQDIVVTAANRDFSQGNTNNVPSLFDRPMMDRSKVMPAGMTGHETRGQNSRGSNDRGGRDNRRSNDWNRQNRGNSDNINKPLMSGIDAPIIRPLSPKRPLMSPPRNTSPSRRFAPSYAHQEQIRRQMSPPRRQQSPPRRHVSPPRNPHSDIFQRRPANRQPQTLQDNNDNSRRGQSPPPIARRDQNSGRPLSPPRRFPDDWDMQNSRGSMQTGNWNQRGSQIIDNDRNLGDKRWGGNDNGGQNSRNWDDTSSGSFMRKQNEGKEGMWMSGGGDLWNAKPMNQQWSGGNGGQGPSGDNWNFRKDTYGQTNQRGDWREKGGDKGDWSDLPEDARDPWGDDNNDKMDQSWKNKSGGNNWQKNSAPASLMSKPIWPGMNNQSGNEPQRWMPQNNDSSGSKSLPSGNWQQGNNNYGMNNWRGQNFSNFSPQRQNNFGSNNFKDGR